MSEFNPQLYNVELPHSTMLVEAYDRKDAVEKALTRSKKAGIELNTVTNVKLYRSAKL